MVWNVTMILSACTFSSISNPASAVGADPQSVGLPFEGMWISEGDAPAIVVFTESSIYWVESTRVSEAQAGARERFANIVSYDLANNHISVLTKWIRVNSLMVSFDAPSFNITYAIEGDTLRMGVGWEGEFAIETDPLVYFRK